MNGIHPHALIAIIGFLGIAAIVMSATIPRGKESSAAEYFLGSRSLGMWSIGPSLFVTGVAALWLLRSAFNFPISTIWIGLLAAGFAVLLGVIIAPACMKGEFFTLPQFLTKRFDRRPALAISAASILFTVGIKIPLVLIVSSGFIGGLAGVEAVSTGLMAIVIFTGLYTIIGGYRSVLFAHRVQAAVVVFGFLAMLFMTLVVPGGEFTEAEAGAATSPVFSLPFVPTLVLMILLLAWHWLGDQSTVQRVFGAKDAVIARRSVFVAVMLLCMTMAMMLAGSTVGNGGDLHAGSSTVLPVVSDIQNLLVLALVMATLAIDFHSTATLVTMDFFRAISPGARDESLVLSGRLVTTMIVILAILAISTLSLIDNDLVSVLWVTGVHITPPIIVVVLAGFVWRPMNGRGALWSIIIGEGCGVVHLIVQRIQPDAALDLMVFITISLIASVVAAVTVSLATPTASLGPVALTMMSKKK